MVLREPRESLVHFSAHHRMQLSTTSMNYSMLVASIPEGRRARSSLGGRGPRRLHRLERMTSQLGDGRIDNGHLAPSQAFGAAAPLGPAQSIHPRALTTAAGQTGHHLQHEPGRRGLGTLGHGKLLQFSHPRRRVFPFYTVRPIQG